MSLASICRRFMHTSCIFVVSWLNTIFFKRTLASTQAEIIHLGEHSNREQEIVGISDRIKEVSSKAGLAGLLTLAMAFISFTSGCAFSQESP